MCRRGSAATKEKDHEYRSSGNDESHRARKCCVGKRAPRRRRLPRRRGGRITALEGFLSGTVTKKMHLAVESVKSEATVIGRTASPKAKLRNTEKPPPRKGRPFVGSSAGRKTLGQAEAAKDSDPRISPPDDGSSGVIESDNFQLKSL